MMAERPVNICFSGDTVAGSRIIDQISRSEKVRLAGVMYNSRAPICDSFGNINIKEINSSKGLDFLRRLDVDLIVNFNSTIIFSKDAISMARLGAVNFHPGPLPERAGLNVGQWAIFEGGEEFGCTLHWMEERVDAGNIIGKKMFPLLPSDTGLTLYAKSLSVGLGLVEAFLAEVAGGETPPGTPQDKGRLRYYRNVAPNGGIVDFSWPTARIMNLIRALSYRPFVSPTSPPLFIFAGKALEIVEARPVAARESRGHPGRVIAVGEAGIEVETGDGAIRLVRLAMGESVLAGIDAAKAYCLTPETRI